ncbi:hypothetical protein U1Q18_005527 [Sarracenia purpurea var. burkii]
MGKAKRGCSPLNGVDLGKIIEWLAWYRGSPSTEELRRELKFATPIKSVLGEEVNPRLVWTEQGTKNYSGPKILNRELKFATPIKGVFGEGVAAPVVPNGLPKVEVEEKNELRPVEARDLAAISSDLELKEVNVSCPKLDEVSGGVDNDATGEDESESSESCSGSTTNEATSELEEVESEKEVKSADDLDDSDLEEKETGQGTAKEVRGEDAVDEDKEQIALPSGRGEDFPKAAITNIRPSAHNMFDKIPKKGLLQQKMRAVPVSEFSESEELNRSRAWMRMTTGLLEGKVTRRWPILVSFRMHQMCSTKGLFRILKVIIIKLMSNRTRICVSFLLLRGGKV